jgi:hypothetical protein
MASGISAMRIAPEMGNPAPKSLSRAFQFFGRRGVLQQIQNLEASCI